MLKENKGGGKGVARKEWHSCLECEHFTGKVLKTKKRHGAEVSLYECKGNRTGKARNCYVRKLSDFGILDLCRYFEKRQGPQFELEIEKESRY